MTLDTHCGEREVGVNMVQPALCLLWLIVIIIPVHGEGEEDGHGYLLDGRYVV